MPTSRPIRPVLVSPTLTESQPPKKTEFSLNAEPLELPSHLESRLRQWQASQGCEPTGTLDRQTTEALLGTPLPEHLSPKERVLALQEHFELSRTGTLDNELLAAFDRVLPTGMLHSQSTNPLAHRLLSEAPSDSLVRVISAANRHVESGGREVSSGLRTTAGNAASFGQGQLTIQAHLEQLGRMSQSSRTSFGVSDDERTRMVERGDAMMSFFDVVVRGEIGLDGLVMTGLSRHEAERVRELALSGSRAELVADFGQKFADVTGLLPADLGSLAETAMLTRTDIREAFAQQYERDHGVAFDPAHRDASRMATTYQNVTLEHPELISVTRTLGGDETAIDSAAHYTGVGDIAENAHGWYARAAQEVIGGQRFASFIESCSSATTAARDQDNIRRAVDVVSAANLSGEDRVLTIARISRCFHIAPSSARQAFLVGGEPRFHSAVELQEAIGRFVESRSWSDERIQSAVHRALAEEET